MGRKAQMFIVTAVFMTSMLFFLQQALVIYTQMDATRPFMSKEVYILDGIRKSVEDTIKAGGSSAQDCTRFQDNVEDLLLKTKEDVNAEGYVLVTNFELECDYWTNTAPAPPPTIRG